MLKIFHDIKNSEFGATANRWRPYRSAVRKQLKGATIVIDRFHVMKQLNHQLDLLRRKLRQDQEANPELSELLKNSRWALLKNRDNLSQKEEEKLQVILVASARLCKMYPTREKFRLICNGVNSR